MHAHVQGDEEFAPSGSEFEEEEESESEYTDEEEEESEYSEDDTEGEDWDELEEWARRGMYGLAEGCPPRRLIDLQRCALAEDKKHYEEADDDDRGVCIVLGHVRVACTAPITSTHRVDCVPSTPQTKRKKSAKSAPPPKKRR
jgi:hypothetical protein